MYWRITVLQGIYIKHMEMESKCTTKKAQNKQIRRVAHLPIQFGPSTGMAMLLAQLQTTMRKAVAGWPHLGAATPRVRRYP